MATERPLAILVIDGDETGSAEIKAAIADAGHVGEVVLDADQVAAAAAEQRFDAVFVDVGAAGSWSALRDRLGPAAGVPVVAMSALPGGAGDWAEAPFVAHLQKPLDPDELTALVEEVLRRHAPSAPADAIPPDRDPAELHFRQRLYDRIHRLPRGRGVVERWVRRIPGLDLPRENVVVPTVFGTHMRVNPSDNSLEKSVYVRGIYEVPGTALLLSVLPKVKVFWDVGAHVGYHTLLASRVMGAGGQVVAFEPHPRVMGLLRDNVECFGGPNIVLQNVGLSDVEGEQEIYDEGDDVTRAPTFVPGIYGKSGHRCVLRTGDDLIDSQTEDGVTIGRPDFIKIDIEGYEDRAFKGLTRLLSSPAPPMLMFELNDTFNPDSSGLLTFLAARGGYRFSVERSEARYPIARRPSDAPAAGFVPLSLDAVPPRCNVLGWCPDVHRGLLGDA